MLWRRANRRLGSHRRTITACTAWLLDAGRTLGRWLWLLCRTVAAVGALVGAICLGRLAIAHVVASPRFAVREIRVSATSRHVPREEILRRAEIQLGGRLLAIDTDAVATRIAAHPWVAGALVRRELPATVVIEVTERQAGALAVLGGLYLVDQSGRPFKRATLEESDGLVVLTGISRAAYAEFPQASQAALREALELLSAYVHPDLHPDGLVPARASRSAGQSAGHVRPALSEIHLDAHSGYTLILYEGGGQVRLGRDGFPEKLARLDAILADLAAGPPGALAALRVVHLDGPAIDRVPIRFAASVN
jgi:cell division septal protein FtsQ